jgi:hypothetical protein
MDKEKPDKTARYTLGVHRGPFVPNVPDAIKDQDSAAFDHVETLRTISSGKVQHTRAQKVRRHWKRFWCCYSFFGIILLAVFLPILYSTLPNLSSPTTRSRR